MGHHGEKKKSLNRPQTSKPKMQNFGGINNPNYVSGSSVGFVRNSQQVMETVNEQAANQLFFEGEDEQVYEGQEGEEEEESPNVTPVKGDVKDEPEYTDMALKLGFQELQSTLFQHHTLDSYLQKSIMDPYNLVQGGISPDLTDIFKNCAFLFPFSTKQLYFKLVSFISAIDAHRAIYFLRQYIKQQGGASNLNSHGKDNLKKTAKQKAVIRRDKLIPSAFSSIQ